MPAICLSAASSCKAEEGERRISPVHGQDCESPNKGYVLNLSVGRDCRTSKTNEGVCGSASQVERPGVNGVPPEMVRASDNRRPMATNRTKRPAVGIPASQPACNFLESRPPALVHMGPGLNTCCLSSPCSHFVIRERSNIEARWKKLTKRRLWHCEAYELMSLCV